MGGRPRLEGRVGGQLRLQRLHAPHGRQRARLVHAQVLQRVQARQAVRVALLQLLPRRASCSATQLSVHAT